jgi:GABA(A) receptor-associated protein
MTFFNRASEAEHPSFSNSVSVDTRRREAEQILMKYNYERVPVIVERAKVAKTMPLIRPKKFIIPTKMTYAQFLLCIRKKVKLTPEETICLFINNIVPPSTQTIGQLYHEHKDEDLFLKAVYSNENAYGM